MHVHMWLVSYTVFCVVGSPIKVEPELKASICQLSVVYNPFFFKKKYYYSFVTPGVFFYQVLWRTTCVVIVVRRKVNDPCANDPSFLKCMNSWLFLFFFHVLIFNCTCDIFRLTGSTKMWFYVMWMLFDENDFRKT